MASKPGRGNINYSHREIIRNGKKRGLNQSQIAVLLGVTKQRVSALVRLMRAQGEAL